MTDLRDTFSQRLRTWLSDTKPKTLQALLDTFQDQSFAVLFLILMATPALPIPTAGITHIFEIIVMLLALEMIWGKGAVWLPKRWRSMLLTKRYQTSLLKSLLKLIGKVERFSRPRMKQLLATAWWGRFVGVVVFALTLFAFLSPPLSGLDTLPAMGVVLISLGMILSDVTLIIIGCVVGAAGVILIATLAKLAFNLF